MHPALPTSLVLAALALAGEAAAQQRRPRPAAGGADGFGGRIHLAATCEARIAWQSNLFLRDRALGAVLPVESDWVSTLRPGMRLNLGDGDSRLHGVLSGGLGIVDLREFDAYASTTPYLEASFGFDDGIVRASAALSHEESSLPSPDYRTTLALFDRVNDTASADFDYDATDASDLNARIEYWAVDYTARTPEAPPPPSQTVVSLPLEWRYFVSERLYLGPGLRPRHREVGSLYASEDTTVFLAASWELTPALNLVSRAGLGLTSSAQRGDETTFGYVAIDVRCAMSEMLALGLSLSSDLDTDVQGQLTQRDAIDVSLGWTPTETRSATVRLGWNRREALYNQQRQDQFSASITTQAAWSEQAVLFASLQGIVNRSNRFGWDYESITVSAGGSLRW